MSSSVQERQAPAKTALCGLFNRRERWGFSTKGALTCVGLLLLLSGFFILGVEPFLAVTDRVSADVLVVEGWVHEYAARAAAAEFQAGAYQRVFTTGGPVEGLGGYVNDFQTSASVGAELLLSAGVPGKWVQMVPSRETGRDRTYNSAVALKQWFRDHSLTVHAINVVTEDAHARRTRLLYQKAFGEGIQVGVISIPSPDYDARYWWRFSQGVREVVGESLAYIYARCFFHPFE